MLIDRPIRVLFLPLFDIISWIFVCVVFEISKKRQEKGGNAVVPKLQVLNKYIIDALRLLVRQDGLWVFLLISFTGDNERIPIFTIRWEFY